MANWIMAKFIVFHAKNAKDTTGQRRWI